MRLTSVLPALLLLAPVMAGAQAKPADAPSSAFTGADLFGLSIAADPQISPDGRTIVYVRRSGDIMTDRMQSSLWLVDVASGRQTPLRHGRRQSPRWSPDGTPHRLCRARDGDRAQLFVRWIGDRRERAGHRPARRPAARSPGRPTARRLAYIATVAGRRRRKLGKRAAQARGREMGRAARGDRPRHLPHRRPRLRQAGLRPRLRRRRRTAARARQLTFGKYRRRRSAVLDARRARDPVRRDPRRRTPSGR